MKKPRRNYSQKTLKILFALSGNECAAPGCTVSVVIPATDRSKAQILGHICHIYSFAKNGPRGKAGLTEEDINSHENLIVLCPNHHTVVDRQHETYPASTLRKWKETHEGKTDNSLSEDLVSGQADVIYYPVDLVDRHITNEIGQLRKSQFFVEFDGGNTSLTFARKLLDGELRGGTDSVRSWALTWCARILTARDMLDEAIECLNQAKHLGGDEKIADALILSRRGGKGASLDSLFEIDSLESRTAALMVAGHHDGPQGVIDWTKSRGIEASDLDPDGKYLLIKSQLELRQWEDAGETASTLTEKDLEESPILHFAKAVSYLSDTVPVELRHVVISKVPFEAASFSLDSRKTAIDARRTAIGHFVRAREITEEFRCPRAAAVAESYALWLELEDPENFNRGKNRLAARLENPRTPLHLVPLGLQYGIPLDQVEVEQEIEWQDSSGGGNELDMAFARLALACMQKSPIDIADYIACHFDTLSTSLDARAIRSIQIEMLANAGIPERANEYLELLLDEGLSWVEERRLRITIEKAEGKETLDARKRLFEVSKSIIDLEALVNELGAKGEWGDLCNYGEILFDERHSLHDAERLTHALHFAGRSARAIELLEANDDILSQSTDLQLCYCWALFHEGAILRAHDVLSRLEDDWEDENYRTLQINLAVAIGDWDSLSGIISNGYKKTDDKSSRELVKVAELSLYLNLRSAKELLFAAAERGKDEADVLSHAFFLATRAALEADEGVADWLHRAVELSGEDGPFWPVTVHDILDLKPEWERQEFGIRRQLNCGEAPMFFAAQFLSKSLTTLTLFPALVNPEVSDLRLKVGVSAFSGQRGHTRSVAVGAIGLDYTAILTLGLLDLLEKVIDAFDTVYVPHSALAWLFEERQSTSFHQPSRIRDARQIISLYINDSLEKLSPAKVADRELADLVGDELALLIAEAENDICQERQRLVVRPNPVYKISTLGQEKADLTRYPNVLSSCQAVVNKLSDMGAIIESEERTALAQLQLRLKEKPWPHQPKITEKAILYLDNLSVYYLLHTKMLEKLLRADFKLIVSPSLISESSALIAFDDMSSEVLDVLEGIRAVVSKGIKSKTIEVGKWRKIDEGDERSILDHQLISLLALTEDCDLIIADDRFLNQHQHIEHEGNQTPLSSTLDLLDTLVSLGSISPEERLDYRTRLRRAGYFFVPVSEEELNCHLEETEVSNGKVIEKAHLKAIRESILHAKMNDWLQLPKEGPWPKRIFEVFVKVLRNLWTEGADVPRVEALSDWLWDQVDVRGWAHLIEPQIRNDSIRSERTKNILILLTPLDVEVPLNMREAYWMWLEDRVLAPIKEQESDLYAIIVDLKRRSISELADTDLSEVDNHDE